MADEKAKRDWSYNMWIKVFEGDANLREVNIELDRYPDGKLWESTTKTGKKCIYGIATIPGSAKKIKIVMFERNKDSIAPIKEVPKKKDIFDDDAE